MNSNLKKIIIIVGTSFALAGCSLTDAFTTKKSSPTTEDATQNAATQVESSTTSEMGSTSYKVESTTPTTPAPTATTTSKSDEPEDLQKDLDSVSIESDFGALVK